MVGGPELVPGFHTWHRQEDRQTCADELAYCGVRRSTMLAVVTGRMSVGGRVHHRARMSRVVRLHSVHPRSMGCADRSNHGDRKDGKD